MWETLFGGLVFFFSIYTQYTCWIKHNYLRNLIKTMKSDIYWKQSLEGLCKIVRKLLESKGKGVTSSTSGIFCLKEEKIPGRWKTWKRKTVVIYLRKKQWIKFRRKLFLTWQQKKWWVNIGNLRKGGKTQGMRKNSYQRVIIDDSELKCNIWQC